MRYLLQLSIIGLITLVSEGLSWLIPLPIPAGIYGLVLLFSLLMFRVIRLEWVENAADFLLAVMPIMFVPAASSLMTKWELIKDDVAGLLITSVVSTAIVMAVSGLVTQFVIRRRKKGEKQASADATPKGGSRA
ncbi:MAG: CidA/LrgA family protein [Parasporobacterium sp.]|nr:CidA/LrgA family protein [Parasporobacterium sp.]